MPSLAAAAQPPARMTKPILAIDVDEVLALFIPALATFHNSEYQTQLEAEHFHSYEFHKVSSSLERS